VSTYPQIVAGMALTSALLQSMLPQEAVKSSGTPRAATTTMTADLALTAAVAAGASYDVDLLMIYNGPATNTGDLKFEWLVPSGATFAGGFLGVANPLALYSTYVTATTVQVSYGNGTGNPLWCMVTGTLITSATAGNLQVQWAQNTSNATATTLMTGSKLSARRIS
jgi:hypothetical protein